ncbi:PRC-barrel domain-containing protein [Clostridium cylindrosporum]|uniref:PRC-barrel domain-containing protein n=1 Tax=Clostridium cylindrosporum DSM 605 TaxID=1121307 RepID=A0A0J8DAG5_CLOCY|nr:PRC-barrel domain-containing protein [Clostridium cylindrosporum]KMT21298.1 hypothetical protein CLCY_2c00580 [Clostridium cylindrosporum DSM 605]
MRKYLDIHGKNLYNKYHKKLGFIDNGIIDYKSRKITSYIVSDGGIVTKVYIAPLSNIEYKKDEIVTGSSLIPCKKKLIKKNYRYTVEGILGREVVNEDGRIVGEVEDVILNHITGDIKAIICKRGFFDDLVQGKKIMLINDNLEIKEDKIIASKSSVEIISEISFNNDFEEM